MSRLIALLALTGIELPSIQGGTAAPPNPTGHRLDFYGDPLPPGALARLGTIRFRGGDYGPFFLPDGKTVATANPDAIQFWEIASGKFLRQILIGPGYRPLAIAFSVDGKYAAVGKWLRGGNVIWDLVTGKKVRICSGEGGRVLSFTPDSKRLISLANGTVRVIEVSTGKEIVQRQFAKDYSNMAVSPDGELLAVATGPNTRKLYLWSWKTKPKPRLLKVPGNRVYFLAFSSDGKLLAGADQAGDTIHVWDVAGGQVVQTIRMGKEGVACAALAFTPDGKMLAVADGGNRRRMASGGVYLWDLTQNKLARAFVAPGDTTEHMSISPDDRWVGATSRGGARFWNLHTGEETAAAPAAHRGLIMQIAAARGGLVATAGEDHTVRIWEAASGRQVRKLQLGDYVKAVALCADGSKLVSGSWDKKVRLWEVATGKELRQFPDGGVPGGFVTLGFSTNGKRIVYIAGDFSARVWDMTRNETLARHSLNDFVTRLPGIVEGGFFGRPCCLSPSGRYLAVVTFGKIHVLEPLTSRTICVLPDESGQAGFEVSLAFSPDDRQLLVSAPGKQFNNFPAPRHSISLWELASGKRRLLLAFDGEHADPVAFCPDGRLFAAGSSRAGGDIRLLRVADGKVLSKLNGFHSTTTMLTFSPEGKYLFSAMNNTSALVWDFQTLRPSIHVQSSPKVPDRKQLEALWSDLAGGDAARAHMAIWRLVEHRSSTVGFFRERLKPALGLDPGRVGRLIAGLDDDSFAVRQKSLVELEKLGEGVLPSVRRALNDKTDRSLESRRRLQSLVVKLLALPSTPRCCKDCGPLRCWSISGRRRPLASCRPLRAERPMTA